MREFERNPAWSKDALLDVSRKTGLSEAQVYKWGWDQKRKKYGPELAALMMAPFEGCLDDAIGKHHFLQIEDDFEGDQGIDSEDGIVEKNIPSSQMPNFPQQKENLNKFMKSVAPFPNEALLEKLSNKLA